MSYNKFIYKSGDIKIYSSEMKECNILSFISFLKEKEENDIEFDPETMKWITIHDKNNKLQHILINKSDGTILSGMGGSYNGKKIDDIYNNSEKDAVDYTNKIKNFKKRAIKNEEINYVCDITQIKLTDSERDAITQYSNNEYYDINKLLRNPKELVEDKAYTKKLIRHLSNALKKYKTSKPIITYRGIDKEVIDKMGTSFKEGNVISDSGFCSTSSLKEVANEYIGFDGYLMEMLIPEGSHAASIDSLSVYSGQEFEVLIDRGSKFLIQKINHKKRLITVELQDKN